MCCPYRCGSFSIKTIPLQARRSVVPIGVGVSLSPYVAECERILSEDGLKIQLHSYGTNVEGEWDAVFSSIKRCHEAVHTMGAPRVTTTIRVGTRTDRAQTMEEKVTSVQEKISIGKVGE